MRINLAGAIVAVFLSAAISTSAQTAEPPNVRYRVYGSGNDSCGTWLAERGNPDLNNGNIQWILGFLSASIRLVGWKAQPRY